LFKVSCIYSIIKNKMDSLHGVGYISGLNAGMAVLGGFLIALSTSLNLLLKGRITGMSGIFYSLVTFDKSSYFWKTSLVSGMLCAASILYIIFEDKPLKGDA
jgi:hypothetical protein